jgi:CAP-Gly domain-containing linker protein 1
MSKPRQSAIPTPGKPGSRSTPSRSRASSNAGRHATPTLDVDFVSRAFTDAINANHPASHRTPHVAEVPNGTLLASSALPSGRQSVAGRPSSAASSISATGSFVQRPRTPTALRTPGRPSDTSSRSASRTGKIFDVGDNVRIESLGFEGTLRFLGAIDGKIGVWAGVELSGGFFGKGKNDGSVDG